MSTLSANLKERRKQAGLSLEEVAFRIRPVLPQSLWVTAETIRKYENGIVPAHKANTILLAALCSVYGCKLSDLAEDTAKDAKTVSVASWAHEYVKQRTMQGTFRGTTPRTVDSVLHTFATAVGRDRDPNTLTKADVEKWMQRDVSPSTKRNQLSCVQVWCRWMVDHKHMRHDPTVGIIKPRQPRSVPHRVDDEQVGDLVTALPDARAELIVMLMSEGGLRCGEVSSLQIGDIDLFGKVMRVTGKGAHVRELPLLPHTMDALRRYLAEHPTTTGPLVRSYAHPRKALSPGYISGRVAKWMCDAGLRPERIGKARGQFPSAHWARHGMAQAMVDAGADPRTIQTALGHASLQVVSRYTGLASTNKMRESMQNRNYTKRRRRADSA